MKASLEDYTKYCSLMRMKVNDRICYGCQYEGLYEMFKGTDEDINDMAWTLVRDCIFRKDEDC